MIAALALLGLALVLALSMLLVYRLRLRPARGIAFFHPFLAAGGGGERVLWTAVHQSLTDSTHTVYIYAESEHAGNLSRTLETVGLQFNITFSKQLHDRIKLVPVRWHALLTPRLYPRFTMLGQAFGSILVALECLWNHKPKVYIGTLFVLPLIRADTLGHAFTYPVARLVFAVPRIAAYVHYPTISSDMLARVQSRHAAFNNAAGIATSAHLSLLKSVYYRVFAWFYARAGRACDAVMVNSSWTHAHISQIWGTHAATVVVVYPPCDVSALCGADLEGRDELLIVSVAQFRPEKRHDLQVRALAASRDTRVRLVCVGGVRNTGDAALADDVLRLADQLGVADRVTVLRNATHAQLLHLLHRAGMGLHTMTQEHFGIGVVELMAAGCIPIAHNSGGPKLDIVVPWHGTDTGFLATTAEEFAAAIDRVCALSSAQRTRMRVAARESAVHRFGALGFEAGWRECMSDLLEI
ncbi:MAG: hypothetical protein SGCHY_002099 [Lobulomycetales sp.]